MWNVSPMKWKGSNMNTLQKQSRPSQEQNNIQNFVAAPVNIFETKDGYVLEAEMPGVNKEGLEVTLEGHEITITGRRTTGHVEGQPIFHESDSSSFQRVFQLDPAVDTTKISAKMEQGLLTLSLPKSEQVKPRKIAVND
jgi:HSP20 family protein